LKAGTTVYHGTGARFSDTAEGLTSPCWVTTDLAVAKRFVDYHTHSPKGKRRIIQFTTNRDLRLLYIKNKHSFDEYLEYNHISPYSSEEMAEGVCRLGWEGWYIKANYGPGGDDIMIGNSNALDYSKTIQLGSKK
jgi:hypothetical protein